MKGDVSLSEEVTFNLRDQNLVLDALRAMYWKEERMLIVSDMHLGKAAHFRKNGVPVPRQIHTTDLEQLDLLLMKFNPDCLIFLGDLFHSEQNEEWFDFIRWSNKNGPVRQILVRGNHDVLAEEAYADTKLEVVNELDIGPFKFTHEPEETDKFNITGHVHPGIRLYGRARQTMALPCFFFKKQQGILPAFGKFTGKYILTPAKGDHVFVLLDGGIVGLIS